MSWCGSLARAAASSVRVPFIMGLQAPCVTRRIRVVDLKSVVQPFLSVGHVVAAFAMYHDPSIMDDATEGKSTYLCLPDSTALLHDIQMGLSRLDLGGPKVAHDSVEALPADDTEPKQSEEPGGTKRSANVEVADDFDYGEGWGKRIKRNKPEGMSEKIWFSGVSEKEQPGWTKLTFMYAPKSTWKVAVRYVHPTTTVGDAKWNLQRVIGIPHNTFCCFGLNSQRKLPFTEELTSASAANWDPLEHRVCLPTNTYAP